MPALRSYAQRIGAGIRGFTLAQRTVAIIGIAVLVLGVTALATWMARPTLTPLFTGLAATDASAIVDQLRSDGVSYELSDGGSTILVPQQSVYDERLKAASAGLPAADATGYALLDKMGVTSSEFQQSVTYKRALEGELASTVKAIDGVTSATVRLAIPKPTVFTDQKADPTASVFVQTKPGARLSDDQVRAIVHLTSASVEGMSPDDVAVVDASGKVLSAVGVGVAGGADEQASDYETRVQTAVQVMLDRVVGPGNATVAVAVDVSNETADRVTEQYTAEADLPALNESTTKETYQGSGSAATGVLGPDNIAVPNGGSGDGSYDSEQTTRNNALNKVTETRTIPAGAVRRQTVSVAVDSAVKGVDVAGLTALVQSAAGFDSDRGDVVTVRSVAFNTAGATEAAAELAAARAADEADRLAAIVRTAIVAAAIALPVLVALILVLRRRKRAADADDETIALTAPAVLDMIEASPATPEALEPEPAGGSPRSAIESLAANDPHRAAELLRSFMDDRQPV